MSRTPRLVLIASVSPHERRGVESSLKSTGYTTVAVHDARDAARELAAGGELGVLVIDSGLLEATHDSQWREFRTRHPELGAAVRCLISRPRGSRRLDGNTLLVHPDDAEGLRHAIRALAGGASGQKPRRGSAAPAVGVRASELSRGALPVEHRRATPE